MSFDIGWVFFSFIRIETIEFSFLLSNANESFFLIADDVKAALILKGSPLTKDGKVYMDLKSLELKLETSRLHMNFENLLSENKEVGECWLNDRIFKFDSIRFIDY